MPARNRIVRSWWLTGLSVALIGAFAGTATAQVSAGGAKPGGGKTPRKPSGVIPTKGNSVNSATGRVLKYEPSEKAEGDVIGYLSISPFRRDIRGTSKLPITSDMQNITLGRDTITPDRFAEYFVKGIHVSVGWDDIEPEPGSKSKKPKGKKVTTLSFVTVDVVGKVVEVKDDIVTIRGVPKNDAQWPDVTDSINPNRPAPKNPPKMPIKPRIKTRRLHLKVLSEASSLQDQTGSKLETADIQADQSIEATVVQGSRAGFIVTMKVTAGDADKSADSGDSGRTRLGGGRGGPGGGG